MKKIYLSEESEEFKEIKKDWNRKARSCRSMEDFKNLYSEIFENYEHDYGTICHAFSVMLRAAFQLCDNNEQGGITDFQAQCIMWDFIEKEFFPTNRIGLKIVDYDELLYPQYAHHFEKLISKSEAERLKEAAQRELMVYEQCWVHPDVRAHWKKLANGELPFGFEIEKEDNYEGEIKPIAIESVPCATCEHFNKGKFPFCKKAEDCAEYRDWRCKYIYG